LHDFEDKLRRFIRDHLLFGQPLKLGGGDSFLEKGIIDSTGVLELVGFIEKEFAISVADEELLPDNLDSLDNLVRFIAAKRAA
jgi:acyl carrier protein